MADPGTIAAIATVVSAGSSIVGSRKQAKEAKRSREEQQRAARLQNKQEAIKRRRAVRQRLADARVLRAQTLAAGFAGGVQGSSIVSGAVGGIGTDVASNVGAAGVQFGLETARVGALNNAADAQSAGNIAATQFGGISQAAGLFTDKKSNRAVANLFGF